MQPYIGSGQRIWGWKVAGYLFLAGIGAGAYLTGVAADLAGTGWQPTAAIGVLVGPLLVAAGTLFLLWDLGKPERFWRAAARPTSSWIARGVFILSAFLLIGVLHIATWLWPFTGLATAPGWRGLVAVVGGIAALLTMIYTGLLLGGMRPIPFWSNPMVPMLFLVSALSTGIMLVITVLLIYGSAAAVAVSHQALRLTRIDMLLLVGEGLILLLYLQAMHVTPAARTSATLVLSGALAPYFWGGVIGLGLVIPLAAEGVLAALDPGGAPWLWYTIAVAIPGLAGGLCLRYLVIAGGVKAPLQAAGMLLTFPEQSR